MDAKRVVVWFSDGVTSAIGAKLALEKYSGRLPVVLATCDTGSEDEDNIRFRRDVEKWLGVQVIELRNQKYKNVDDVFRQLGWMKNMYGAPCTRELKKRPRRDFENLATDIQVFGYDANERSRAQRFIENNPEVTAEFPLIDAGITKMDARGILLANNITEPRTYAEGFGNANCLDYGCVKGGMGYWNLIRIKRPAAFERRAKLERELNFAMLRDSDGEPLFLDQLPPDAGNYKQEPGIQCGLFCGEY